MSTSSHKLRPPLGLDGARGGGLRVAATRVGSLVGLGLIPLALVVVFLAVVVPADTLGLDFRESFWPAAQAVLHGHTPYPPALPRVIEHGNAFVYPPVVALALVPFALLPVSVATAIAIGLTALSLAAALWVLGVRDWRCYGAALASPAVLTCLQTAALSGAIALAVALIWRHRERGLVAPLLVVAIIAAKLFLWPLLIWLLLVRGLRCAAATAAVVALVVVAPWLAGFPGWHEYPHLLSLLTQIEGRDAYTPRALALSLGAGTTLAEAIAIALGGALVVLAVAVRRQPDASRRQFSLMLVSAFLLSPIVWTHYFVILLPVIAIATRRLHPAWFALWGLWFSIGASWTTPSTRQIAVSLVVLAAVGAFALAAPHVYRSPIDSPPDAAPPSWKARSRRRDRRA